MLKKYYSAIIITITIFTGTLFISLYGKNYNPLHGDALGYYFYLPTTFIYGNVQDMGAISTIDSLSEYIRGYATFLKEAGTDAGYSRGINQYTYAVALMELPFFAAAHLYEKMQGLPATGFSETYGTAIRIGGFFYALLGILIVYRILKDTSALYIRYYQYALYYWVQICSGLRLYKQA
jgi:hypothetical protein